MQSDASSIEHLVQRCKARTHGTAAFAFPVRLSVCSSVFYSVGSFTVGLLFGRVVIVCRCLLLFAAFRHPCSRFSQRMVR